jgi:hypothetical protein
MDAFRAGLRLIYRCIITGISLAMMYSVFMAVQGETNPVAQTLLVGVGALACALSVAVWSRHRLATYVQLCVIPALAALYLFELVQRDPLDEMLHIEQQWRLVKAKTASGQPFTIQISPSDYFGRRPNGALDLPSVERIFPLGQVADLPTIMCREGARPFAEFEADERGFNNPKGIWGKPVDLMFIGDSMTYGACLPNRDHFITQIRQRFPSTLNLGLGGLGPVIELAQMREFVPKTKPKFIFYMYDENNDLYFINSTGDSDIVREYRNPILRKYLADARFSQRIYERQSEINAALKQLVDNIIASGLAERTPLKSTTRLLGLPLIRASLPSLARPMDPGPASTEAAAETPVLDSFELFKEILSKMVQISAEAGTKFVFVNIPAYQSICDGVDHPMKRRVLDLAQQSGVDLIDLELDFRNADKTIGRDQLFAVPPCGGHFSERGYKVIGDRLVQYLQIQEALAKSADLAGIVQNDGWRVMSSRVGRDETAKPPQMVWRETQVYKSYVKFGAVFPAGSDSAARGDGAGILGLAYKRHYNGDQLRVTVNFTAYSPSGNEIVAALFVGNGAKSVSLSTQEVRRGSSATATVTYIVDNLTDAPIAIEARVGSTRSGELYINGDHTGPAAPGLTSLKIEELRSLPGEELLHRPDLSLEEMRDRGGSLVYVGTPLTESELVKPDQPESWGSLFARTFEGVERWVTSKFQHNASGP